MERYRGNLWLYKSHPNFFFIYAATLVFHFSQAVFHGFAGPGSFTSPALKYAMEISPKYWALGFALVFVGLATGLFRQHWTYARLALTCGAILTIARALFIAAALISGESQGLTGLPVWALVAAVHLSQTAEPPVNPITAKRH